MSSDMSNDRPNLVLIVSEDHGPHLGCYGDANARTPRLDRLAAEGTRFDRHHTTCAICSPGRASILTGLYPHQNGQIDLATHKYSMYRPFANLATVLKENGYRTARLGKLHVLPEAAVPFDLVWNEPDYISFGQRDVVETARVARDFAAGAAADGEPFFVYACFSDAHLPMHHQSHGAPADPLRGEEVEPPDFCPIDAPHMRDRLAGYYNCLERLDEGVGRLLEAVTPDSGRETVVVFTTDHGQQFVRGKTTCYEGGLRVPLILHAPGRFGAGLVRDDLTSHVDILPTVLDALDLPPVPGRPGLSLVPAACGRPFAGREHVVGQWTGAPPNWHPQRSIRDARYKLIVNYLPERQHMGNRAYLYDEVWESSLDEADRAALPADLRRALERAVQPPAEELYDLREDPQELENLAEDAAFDAVRAGLRAALEQWQEEHDDRLPRPEVLEALTDMHDRIRQKHYPDGFGKLPRDRDIRWTYDRWLDPGVPA